MNFPEFFNEIYFFRFFDKFFENIFSCNKQKDIEFFFYDYFFKIFKQIKYSKIL